jgi:alkanesulfonate monooxygenase SsuD/methylene tetrahydromethanopterin reductase-like flavin-dependent oxidoreductase (luciferase family)
LPLIIAARAAVCGALIVGPEAVDPYGRVYDPLVTLGWIAGWTERIGLGTSIVLVPLHNPMHLAKEVATLQELSGGRFTLGVGMGWHKDEFDFMGVEFKNRGRRADEAIRLMRALWNGERDFEGEYWSFHDATSEPHPSPSRRSGSAVARSARSCGRSSLAMRGIPRAVPTPTRCVASRRSTPSYA